MEKLQRWSIKAEIELGTKVSPVSHRLSFTMASTAVLRKKNAAYQNNVHKRGHVKDTLKPKKDWQLPVSLPVLAVLVFIVFGGAFLAVMQIFF